MLRRFLPETLFGRRLDEAAERRLKLAQARAEERLIEAHVENALMFVDALAEDVTYDVALDTYVRMLEVPEPLASTVATRALVILGQELVPTRVRRREGEDEETGAAERPAVRIPGMEGEERG